MQKLLTLIITAAILYMVFQHSMNRIDPKNKNPVEKKVEETQQKNSDSPELSGSFVEKTLSSILINVLKTDEGRMFLENIVTPMDKPLAGSGQGYKINNDKLVHTMFKINTFGEGTGGQVSCGHLVTVKYKILTLANNIVEEKLETFPLGSSKVPGMDPIIVGMKKGQMRQGVIPGKFANPDVKGSKTNFKISIELRDVLPKIFVDETTKIYDDEIAYHLPMLCGQRVQYDAKVTKLTDAEVLYDSSGSGSKIDMNVGNVVYPMIISHSLHNKIPVGIRTVIAKGKYFKSYVSKNSPIFPERVLPEEEFFMLELMNMKVVFVPQESRKDERKKMRERLEAEKKKLGKS